MQSGWAGSPSGTEPWQLLDGFVSWDDLVLPASALDQLKTIPSLFSRQRWTEGAAATASADRRGLMLLFTGPSGTGKTTAARAIAAQLQLPVLQADIESLFSRSRGEASELVAQLFASAERSNAVLELDRADSALRGGDGSRAGLARVGSGDIRDLLRRSESYPGIVVFPSALKHDIPEATRQRFDRTVEFPFPEQAARAEIWRRALPPGARVSGEDIAFLAASFQLPGQAISAVSRQARAAAGPGSALTLEHLAHALEHEYTERLAGPGTRAALSELRRRAPGAGAGQRSAAVPPVATGGQAPASEVRDSGNGTAAHTLRAPVRPWPKAGARPVGAAPSGADAAAAEEPGARAGGAARAPRTRQWPGAETRAGETRTTGESDRFARPRRTLPPALRWLPVVLGGSAAAVALGLAVSGHKTSSTTPAALTLDRQLVAGPVRVDYPSTWQRQSAPRLAALRLSNTAMLASPVPPRGQLIIGTTAASATPLPQAFVSQTVSGTATPELVSLGSHRYYRVLDPRLAQGTTAQSVYALSAPGLSVVALCRTASHTFASDCERVLATLSLGASPGPDPAFASQLNAILAKLGRTRASAGHALATATTAAAQARAASALSSAHAQAAAAVQALAPSNAGARTAAGSLAGALRALSRAYASLSAAAARNDTNGYSTAQGAVSRAAAGLTAALGRLRSLGYTVT